MYIIKVDGKLMYSPELMDDGYKVISPKMHLEVNTAGSLDFTLPPCNVKYADIRKMKSIVTVEQDGEQIFRGRVLEENMDISRLKEMYCEGDLSFFLDSLIAPITFEGTAAQFFSALVSAHNSQMEEDKRFVVGNLSGLDNEKIINIATTTYADTLDTIKALLLDVYGGFIRTRFADGVYYVDYISEYTHECTQKIKFGVNLLDIDSHIDTAELCTVLVPLGASTDDGTALTIAEVNDGSIFIENAELIARYGRIYRTYTWDQVTDPAQLMELGQKYMQENVLSETLTLKAVDMHLTNKNIEKIRLGDKVQLESPAHGIERVSVCAAQDIDLQNGDQSEYTFGLPKQTMADQAVSTAEQLDKVKNSINDQHRWLTETQTALNISVNAINLIGHRTTQLEIDVDAAEEAITMKASQDDVDILGERHTAVELRLDAAEDSITAQAETISLQAEEINLKAGKTYVDNLVAQCVQAEDLEAQVLTVVDGANVDSMSVNTLAGGSGDFDEMWVGQLNGQSPAWLSKEVVTGVDYYLETATTPPFYNANGTQVSAGITYVKNVVITPKKETINYLGYTS